MGEAEPIDEDDNRERDLQPSTFDPISNIEGLEMISIPVPNRLNQLNKLLQRLLRASVRVFGVAVVPSGRVAAVRIVCESAAKAMKALPASEFGRVVDATIVCVEVADGIDLLAATRVMLHAECNIQSVVPLLWQAIDARRGPR